MDDGWTHAPVYTALAPCSQGLGRNIAQLAALFGWPRLRVRALVVLGRAPFEALPESEWRKASTSHGNSDCVEVAEPPDGPVLRFTPSERAFHNGGPCSSASAVTYW